MQKIRKYILSVTNRDGKQEIWTSYSKLAKAYGFKTNKLYNGVTATKKSDPEMFSINKSISIEGLKIKRIEQNVKFGAEND